MQAVYAITNSNVPYLNVQSPRPRNSPQVNPGRHGMRQVPFAFSLRQHHVSPQNYMDCKLHGVSLKLFSARKREQLTTEQPNLRFTFSTFSILIVVKKVVGLYIMGNFRLHFSNLNVHLVLLISGCKYSYNTHEK